MAQLVKYFPAMWETWVQSLGCEDPLEKGKATHSSILVWRIPLTMQAVYIMYFNTLVFIMSEMISHSRVLSRGVR